MRKIIFILGVALSTLFTSCLSDNDDNKTDFTWKNYQDKVYDDIRVLSDANGRIYTELKSESGDGSVYWKNSDFITERMQGDFNQERPEVYPETRSSQPKPSAITDSVIIRYMGWYYNTDGEFTVFDGTEGISGNSTSDPNIGYNNNKVSGMSVSGVIDGFRTALMDMTINEERIICIPSNLAYGSTNQYNSNGQITIPAYTTLFFDIKLLKIYSGDGTLIAE